MNKNKQLDQGYNLPSWYYSHRELATYDFFLQKIVISAYKLESHIWRVHVITIFLNYMYDFQCAWIQLKMIELGFSALHITYFPKIFVVENYRNYFHLRFCEHNRLKCSFIDNDLRGGIITKNSAEKRWSGFFRLARSEIPTRRGFDGDDYGK